jgi:hypothetical protein
MKEIWKDIKWYEWLYQVSNLGQIRNNNRLLKPVNIRTYSRVKLTKNKICRWYYVHRLVAQAFLELDIDYKMICVLHKEELLINNFLNNTINNLKLWTHKENMQDMLQKWRWIKGRIWKLCNNSKKIRQFTKNWEYIKTWDSWMDVQRELWIFQSNLSKCFKWEYKTTWGFIWKLTTN